LFTCDITQNIYFWECNKLLFSTTISVGFLLIYKNKLNSLCVAEYIGLTKGNCLNWVGKYCWPNQGPMSKVTLAQQCRLTISQRWHLVAILVGSGLAKIVGPTKGPLAE